MDVRKILMELGESELGEGRMEKPLPDEVHNGHDTHVIHAENEIPESERMEETSAKDRRRKCNQGISILCVVLSVCLLAIALPQHIKKVPSTGQRYLDSWGIGAAVWALLFLVGACAALTPKVEDAELSHEGKEKYGTSAKAVRDTFSKRKYWFAKSLFLLAQGIINAAFILHNLVTLPVRDPEELFNQSKHLVIWVEFYLEMLFVTQLLMGLIVLLCGKGNSKLPLPCASELAVYCAKNAGLVANFSVLKSLPKANPMREFQEVATEMHARGCKAAVAVVVENLILVCLAIVAVLIKITQVDFVINKEAYQWDLGEVLAVAGFINNLAGLYRDSDARMQAVFQVLDDSDSEHLMHKWKLNRSSTLRELYGGPVAFAIMCTLSVDDVCQLVRHDVGQLVRHPTAKATE